jgi:hypothetical protein
MYETAVVLTVVLMIVSAVDYVRRAWIQETNPAPTTWILIATTAVLSAWMYLVSPRRSWTANIQLISSVANSLIILIGVIASKVRFGKLKMEFDRGQKQCLLAGAAVVPFWMLTQQALLAYILVQAIAVIAYWATVKRLRHAKACSEPTFLWVCVLLASLCAVYPAWARRDLFAWILLVRVIPSTAIMIYLISRAKQRMRQAITNDPIAQLRTA